MLAAAVVGAVTRGRRAPWILAPAALIGAGFLVLALAGLSLQARYLVGIAAVAALLAGDRRSPGAGAGSPRALLAGAVVYAAGDLVDTRERLDDDAPALEALVRGAAAVRARARPDDPAGAVRRLLGGRAAGRDHRARSWARREPDHADGRERVVDRRRRPGAAAAGRGRAAGRLRARSQATN